MGPLRPGTNTAFCPARCDERIAVRAEFRMIRPMLMVLTPTQDTTLWHARPDAEGRA